MRPRSVMQVCVVGTAGGVEHHTLALALRQQKERDVVLVAAAGGWLQRAATTAGLRVVTIPEPHGNFDLRTLRALRKAVRVIKPSIVHSHLGRSDWYSWLAVIGMRDLRLVSTEHGISQDRQELFVTGVRRVLHEWAHRQRFKRTDAVVAVSPATARILLERYPGLSVHPPVVISPGVDAESLFEVAQHGRATGGQLRLVAVCRLAAEKGVDVAIAAVDLLVERGVDARLTVLGDGPAQVELSDQIARGGLEGHVSLVGRVEDVAPSLADADVFVLTSRTENLPIAMLEAMAAGLPVVASAVGGVPDVLGNGGGGLIVPAEDPIAVADAIALLDSDEALRLRLGREARVRARSYDMQHTVDAVDEVYESLC